jgi:hypothetical protein
MRTAAILSAALALAACSSVPRVPERAPRPAAVHSAPQCLAQLGLTRASFTPLPDRYVAPGCATVGTVQLARLGSDDGALAVTNLGPVTCELASRFAAWARFGVDRAARQILGSALVRIETMGSFSCRNVAGTARRSAHATAEAIDVAAFVLADGRRIAVREGWSGGSPAEREFLRLIHTSACRRFGTVLGPAYNQAHADHLHVELGGGGFCR